VGRESGSVKVGSREVGWLEGEGIVEAKVWGSGV